MDEKALIASAKRGDTRAFNELVAHYQSTVYNLAYRILNLLTDTSFRARLLTVTYLYTDDDREVESYAILIEHKDRLSKRINGKPLSM